MIFFSKFRINEGVELLDKDDNSIEVILREVYESQDLSREVDLDIIYNGCLNQIHLSDTQSHNINSGVAIRVERDTKDLFSRGAARISFNFTKDYLLTKKSYTIPA